MSTELHSAADTSAQLDRLLFQYLLAHGGKRPSRAWPSWRDHGRHFVDQRHAAFNTMDDARPASRESLVPTCGNRHFD